MQTDFFTTRNLHFHNWHAAYKSYKNKFAYDPESDSELKADFKEVAVIVPKDWLYTLIKRTEFQFLPEEDADEEVKNFLDNEYTYDDSEYWYDRAVKEEKIVAVDFV